MIQIDTYFSEGLFEKVTKFSKIEGYDEYDIRLLNKIGVAQMHLEQYCEAKNTFKKILNRNKSDTYALFNLGLTYEQLEDKFEKAIHCFKEVMNLKPRHFNCLTSLGILYFKVGEYELAKIYINKVLDVSEGDDWKALLAKGCILAMVFKDMAKQKFVLTNAMI